MTSTQHCSTVTPEQSNNLSLEQALARTLSAVASVAETEDVLLAEAKGRILAERLCAAIDLPPFAASAMDGYALRYADPGNPQKQSVYKIVGNSFAGAPYLHGLEPGECVRILTGAVAPSGTDTVVIQENTRRQGDILTLTETTKAGANIRYPGDDVAKGAILFEAGKLLTPADIGLIAANGMQRITVKRKLHVAYFSTGNELVSPGSRLKFGQIYDSNGSMLRALLKAPFITSVNMGIVGDDPRQLEKILKEAAEMADVVISSGGISVGDADHVINILEKTGKIEFWKVAIKPGRPCAFGKVGSSWFFGLPGNPVAVLVVFSQLVRPALDKLGGCTPRFASRFKARCLSVLKKSPGRCEFQRGVLSSGADGIFEVASSGEQGSNRISSVSRANCFIVLPPESRGVSVGEMVDVELIESFL